MNFNRKNITVILFLIIFFIATFALSQNLKGIIGLTEIMLDVLSPFIFGFCIAFILNVIMKFLEESVFPTFSYKRPLCIFLSIAIIVFVLYLLFSLIIPEVRSSTLVMIENLPKYIDSLNSFIDNLNINHPEISKDIIDFILPQKLSVLNTTIDITSALFDLIIDSILSLVFAVYLLLDKELLIAQFHKLLSSFLPPKTIEKFVYIGTASNKIFSRFLIAQCIDSAILGVSCYIGMIIFQLPYAPMISSVVTLTSLIPMIGGIIGGAIGILMILLVEPIKAVWFFIFIFILEEIEGNFVYPKIVGKSTGLPGIWILFAVTVGGNIAGIAGMLISVPLCSVLYFILRNHVNKISKIQKK